jgi:hypothetical protein
MDSVIRWVYDSACGDAGLNEDETRHAVNLSESDLAQLIGTSRVSTTPRGTPRQVLNPQQRAQHLAALRELREWREIRDSETFLEVMTRGHFANYFADALSRAFYDDYQYDVGSWRDYTYPDTTPDFRDVKRFRMSEPGTLYKRRDKQQLSATSITPTQIQYGVEEYGDQFDVSWQTILNDDLGKIRETPTRMVNAARRWLDEWVSALYDNATTQAALVALGVVYAGTGRLTPANLAIGLNAMMQRVDVNGNQMNINRVWLVIPKVLELQAAQILQDLLQYGGAGGNVLNQFVAGVRVDPYIGFAGANVPWYLFADPSEVPTVTVARLQGWDGPVAFMKRSDIQMVSGTVPQAFLMGSFATGDIEFAVEDIIGGWDDADYVGVTDFRGIYYSSGTTP